MTHQAACAGLSGIVLITGAVVVGLLVLVIIGRKS